MTAPSAHILIIDDNEDILIMLHAMLQFKGYKVSTKATIENLESFIIGAAPDIILMDMLLSGTDGKEVCKLVKANSTIAHIPIIMISAHPNARVECLAAGANYFLDKPFEMNELFEMTDKALSK